MDAHTALAIETFHKLLRAERRVETLENELRGYVLNIPAEEMEVYFNATTEEE